jgi:hypothetical protein
MEDRPHYLLRFYLAQTGTDFGDVDPTFIDDKHLGQAWNMLNAFIMDMLDRKGEEVTDERFREIFIEMCYYLILREMRTLKLMPVREKNFANRLTEGKSVRKPPRRRKKKEQDEQ